MMKRMTPILALSILTLFMAACAPALVSGTTTPGTPGTSVAETPEGTAAAGSCGSTATVDELTTMVNNYVTSGDITGNAENGLLAKLDTIKQKVLNCQSNPAANELGAFVNEVQAQAGKKISDAAAAALIAKAQALATALNVTIPVTGPDATPTATAVAAASQPPTQATAAGTLSAPTPLGVKLQHQPQWDAIAAQVMTLYGVSTYSYDLYQIPATETWADTLAYYTTQAASAGWGAAPGQVSEMAGGHYAVWTVTGADGRTNYFVVAQRESDGSYSLNILGSK